MRAAAAAAGALLVAVACRGGGVTSQPLERSPQPTERSPQPLERSAGATPSPAASPSPQPSPATPRPTGLASARVTLTRIATLNQPLGMALPPGDDTLYVAEKGGRVRAVRGGAAETVLDLSGEVSGGSEQGLLGLAFSPGGFLYVNFTDRAGDTRIREYAVRSGRPDPASAREVLFVDQPYANHNGGNLVFGPDGLLYIGLGDGGSGGDPQGNAQNLGVLLGKMLRIDPRPAGDRPYGIPPGNPFVGRAGARPEIWAYGLRNPWRYSFDRASGDLWIGDVGQDAWEEIDYEPRGQGGRNYGWNRMEGNHRFKGVPPPDHAPPIFEYPLRGGNCAVVGGYVYRGSRIPALAGAYLFADFCAGRLRALIQEGGRVTAERFLGPRVAQLASFGEDHAGELYVLSLAGGVFRIDPA